MINWVFNPITAKFDAVDQPIVATGATAVSIANTETRAIGRTIYANGLRVGTVVRFAIMGLLTNTTTASSTVIRLRIGPTTLTGAIIQSFTIALGTTARTNQPFVIDAMLTILSVGAAGTAQGVITLQVNTATALAAPSTTILVAVVINTTVANEVEATIISGAATTTWNCTTRMLAVTQA